MLPVSKLIFVFAYVLLMTCDSYDTSMSRVAANTLMCSVAACDCLDNEFLCLCNVIVLECDNNTRVKNIRLHNPFITNVNMR